MAGITFDDVTKTYGDGYRAVSDLNLDVDDGEFVVLVGPSGCGKTTALRMIAGLEEIPGGQIRFGEPLSNLDAKLRVQMRAEILRIQRQLAVTTVYVTHDQVEAMTMGDRVAVMRRGLLQQFDAPQRLYEGPCNLFVASFIGSPAMNVLEATLERDGDGAVCRVGESTLRVPPEVLSVRPALLSYEGKNVAV